MKRIFLIALVMMLPFCTFAQKKGFKLVEKSGPKPEWVGQGSVKNFIIVQSEKPTLEQVKADAMDKVRAEIASSVATNVSRIVDSYSLKEVNGDDVTTSRTMTIETTSKIARMPAIQGVSLTKAETYQEMYRNKKTGEVYYVLYVKYPFSSFDLVDLVTAYEEHEEEINAKIKSYEDDLNDIKSVEQVDVAITALGALSKEVGDEDTRYYTIDGIVKRYLAVYDNITINVVENTPGRLTIRLMYAGKVIVTSQKPKVTSNCAEQFSINNQGEQIVITYNKEYCYAQDDNYLDVRYRFGSKSVKEQVFFKLK